MKFPTRDLRIHTARPHIVPVVTPNGLIKHLRINNTMDTPILTREMGVDPNTEAVFLVGVEVAPAFRREHWVLLQDLFREDGPDGEERWGDYVRHIQYTIECEMAGQKPDPFPRDRLPEEIERRQRGEGAGAKVFEPRSRPRGEGAKGVAGVKPGGRARASAQAEE